MPSRFINFGVLEAHVNLIFYIKLSIFVLRYLTMKYLLLVVIATTALTVHAAPAEIQVITTIKTHYVMW